MAQGINSGSKNVKSINNTIAQDLRTTAAR